LALSAVVLFCHSGALRNGFTGYDDPDYVTSNPHVNTGLTGANVLWAFTAAYANNWHPLTWISHALDCTLFGLNATGHHLTSVLLHVLTTVLLFLWLEGLTRLRARSAFVALAFGLHPLHVESVAWIAERKDVLSAFFWMGTLLAYEAYRRQPGVWRYLVVAALLAAGLLSKPMVVTLPVILLLVDLWQGRPARVVEKLPLFALAAVASTATVWAHQQGGSVAAMEALPLGFRVSNAAIGYMRYLSKTIWPVDLAVFYPMPATIPLWAGVAAGISVALITVAVIAGRRRHPALAFGWAWYVITLLPVIGIVQTGMQSIADRYMYLPMVGLLIAVAWELAPLRGSAFAAAILLIACAVLTGGQIPVWRDGVTLFTHAIAATDGNFVAHNNLGVELDRRGQPDAALEHYREAIRIRPGDRNSERNYGQAVVDKGGRLCQQGRFDEALAAFHEGLQHRPDSALAHFYIGMILMQREQIPPAIGELRQAIAMDPKLARAHVGLGVALAHAGNFAGAKRSLGDALRIDPANAEAKYDLELIQRATGGR
jgi:Tfp pilus assembly protein PilF